ncbi:MAG TPA: serine/threonine-protein kinase [Gemmatimonadales bacterium]
MTHAGAVQSQLQTALAGAYRIERELGRGSMARVFLAHDLRHNRDVAVKLLPPETATPDAAERFLREIRITAALQHPNILSLLDSGAATGLCWYVMPYVEGESIRDRLASGPLPLLEAAKVALQVARGLSYAHAQGVIHRDIKPENIMLSGGQAMITDFGLGRAVRGDAARLTAMGLPLGTPAYMSPELIQGEDADTRSDIYGLGCVFYEMVTGRPPFIGSLAEVLRQHVNATAAPPSRYRPGVPAAVDRASERALAKAPKDRYPKADTFAADLEQIAALATLDDGNPPEREKKGALRRLLDKLIGA